VDKRPSPATHKDNVFPRRLHRGDVTEGAELCRGSSEPFATGSCIRRLGIQCRGSFSGMAYRFLELEWLLDYELRSSMRYGRAVSLVMVSAINPNADLKELLRPILRESDELFETGDDATILMGHTDCDEALAAIRRYKGDPNLEMGLCFAVASFPDDGRTVQELLTSVRRRLSKAVTLGRGVVVATG